jgi:hypothetical protein
MPTGSKDVYTLKQKRKAARIEESGRDAGRSREDAERNVWATVNRQDGGGKRGSGVRDDGKRSSS